MKHIDFLKGTLQKEIGILMEKYIQRVLFL